MELVNSTVQHIPAIRRIVDETWPVAYGAILSSAQIAYMIGRFYSNDALAAQLSGGHRFLLAVENGAARAFAGFELAYEPGTAKLHKLYVLPAMQGTGLGKLLLNAVMDAAKTAGQEKIILNVNRYNKALEFYKKCGFTIFKEENIDIGSGYFMNDYVLVRDLS